MTTTWKTTIRTTTTRKWRTMRKMTPMRRSGRSA
jgi:hypothetical protein